MNEDRGNYFKATFLGGFVLESHFTSGQRAHSFGMCERVYLPLFFKKKTAGYLKKEEAEGGHRSTSIKNVFCLETIKCLPAWLTPSAGGCPPRLGKNNDYCTLPSSSL